MGCFISLNDFPLMVMSHLFSGIWHRLKYHAVRSSLIKNVPQKWLPSRLDSALGVILVHERKCFLSIIR